MKFFYSKRNLVLKGQKSGGSSWNLESFMNVLWLVFCIISCVYGQCRYGFESTCRWIRDASSPLPWSSKIGDAGEIYIELSRCRYPNCGMGTVHTPMLPPVFQKTLLTLEYKIFGHSAVFLKLYLKSEKYTQPHLLFQAFGNYGSEFPNTWTSKTINVPESRVPYQLVLKGSTPYEEALIMVKGIRLEGFDGSGGEGNVPVNTPDNNIEDESTEGNSETPPQLRSENFIGAEELTLGYTEVVYPDICKYSKI